MNTLLCTLFLLFSSAVAHGSGSGSQELSTLYQRYKAAKHAAPAKPTLFREVNLPGQDATVPADRFVAPFAGQPTVDYHPQAKRLLQEGEPLTYYSWHIHSYFFHEDENVTARSMALRDQFISAFSLATCDDECFMGGWMDNCTQGMCVWDPVYGVDGPHPYGQWGVYLPNYLVAETVSWFSANHGEFEVMFHPNTGYMVGDHDPNKRALWIKQQVPLDLDFLVWLQCEWFGCSDAATLEQVKA